MRKTTLRAKRFSLVSGASAVEVLVGVSIIVIVITGLISAFALYIKVGLSNADKVRAVYLAEEGIEAMRFIRDRNWTNGITSLNAGTPYHLTFINGIGWQATSTSVLIDGTFTRTVVVSTAYRRNSDEDLIDASAPGSKHIDPETRKVTVEVSWGTGGSVLAVAYDGGTTDADLANFPSNNAGDGNPAQGFLHTEDLPLTQVALPLKRVGAPSDVYLEIREASTVGTLIATSTVVTASTISDTALDWTTFAFPSQPTLTASTQYYLRLRSIPKSTEAFSGSSGTLHWGYTQAAPSPYADGSAWRYVGRLGNSSDQGQELTNYDFSFRVYTTDNPQNVTLHTYLTNLFNE